MAKAFELTKQLRYAAEYYNSTIEELELAGERLDSREVNASADSESPEEREEQTQTKQKQVTFKSLANKKFATAVERITLKRISGDANLRLAICLIKLNGDMDMDSNANEQLADDFLSKALNCIKNSISIYRSLGNREMDLGYSLIWFLRAHYLAGVMERSNLSESDIETVIDEAEKCLKIDDANDAFDAEVLKHKQKLRNELGFVAGQLSSKRAEGLLKGSINNYSEKLEYKRPDGSNEKKDIDSLAFSQNSVSLSERKPSASLGTAASNASNQSESTIKSGILKKGTTPLDTKEKSWYYLQKARAENGLSEYYHNTGNKYGAFKILVQAAKDYKYAGNDRQRSKCLILAVENGVKFMLNTASRRERHADGLQAMLDEALGYYDGYGEDLGSDPTVSNNIHQAYILKAIIYEKCLDHAQWT